MDSFRFTLSVTSIKDWSINPVVFGNHVICVYVCHYHNLINNVFLQFSDNPNNPVVILRFATLRVATADRGR